jgi:hypothetical protein
MAISGMELLERARSLDATGLRALAGPNATPESDSLTRPALVAALLSSFRPADRALVRYLTQFEIEKARAEQVGGTGDVLIACCWLLFMIGQVEDSQLIWEAKELNFDTFCYIDSVFLIPEGIEATVAFARSNGLTDLEDYISSGWIGDPADVANDWRSGRYWASRPAPDQSVETFASWILT